jgi:hypothetical protein
MDELGGGCLDEAHGGERYKIVSCYLGEAR